MARIRKANLGNAKVVEALTWREGDPIQFAVKDESRKGLYLRLSKGGTKTWYFAFRRKGKLYRNWYGKFPEKTCGAVAKLWEQDSDKLKVGINPVKEKQLESAELLEEEARESLTLSVLFHEHYFPRYASKKKSARLDEHYFRHRIEPILGSKPADSITWQDVEQLASIRDKQYNTARLTVSTLRKMYNWAASPDSAEQPGGPILLDISNPCRKTRFRPITDREAPQNEPRPLKSDELRALWNHLDDARSTDRILKLQLLTGCRVSEPSGMHESEIDREASEWVLPGSRAKNGRTHIIPLTPAMLELIGAPTKSGFVFEASRGKGHTTESGVSQAMQRYLDLLEINLPRGTRTHALRDTFTTFAARLGIQRELRNRLTNHIDSSIDGRHYNAHDYLEEKRQALRKVGSEILRITG